MDSLAELASFLAHHLLLDDSSYFVVVEPVEVVEVVEEVPLALDLPTPEASASSDGDLVVASCGQEVEVPLEEALVYGSCWC